MAKVKYEVVATLGEYQNSAGETKKRYQKCGVVFQNEHGLSLKLDTIPVSPDWNGWFSLFDPKPRDERETMTQSRNPEFVEDDEIPF